MRIPRPRPPLILSSILLALTLSGCALYSADPRSDEPDAAVVVEDDAGGVDYCAIADAEGYDALVRAYAAHGPCGTCITFDCASTGLVSVCHPTPFAQCSEGTDDAGLPPAEDAGLVCDPSPLVEQLCACGTNDSAGCIGVIDLRLGCGVCVENIQCEDARLFGGCGSPCPTP